MEVWSLVNTWGKKVVLSDGRKEFKVSVVIVMLATEQNLLLIQQQLQVLRWVFNSLLECSFTILPFIGENWGADSELAQEVCLMYQPRTCVLCFDAGSHCMIQIPLEFFM